MKQDDVLSTKPATIKLIQNPQSTHPSQTIAIIQSKRPKTPSEGILVPTTNPKPKSVITLHPRSKPQRSEIESKVSRFIDHYLT